VTKEDRTIREQIQVRLEELKEELETGRAELQKVEMQRTYLHETVLRISGAIQVLEELLGEGDRAGAASGEKYPATAKADETSPPSGRKSGPHS
jgi:predicted nuclease with TOPRIM domain